MKRAFHLFSIAALLLLGACQENRERSRDILGIELAEPTFHVAIKGPEVIREAGNYEWNALVSGADGETEHEWQLFEMRHATYVTGNGPAFSSYFDRAEQGMWELRLVVRSGDEIAWASTVVYVCLASPPVDECSTRLEDNPVDGDKLQR